MSSYSDFLNQSKSPSTGSSYQRAIAQVEKESKPKEPFSKKVKNFLSLLKPGAAKLGETLGTALFTKTPEYKKLLERISNGKMKQSELYEALPTLKKSTAQILSEGGETVLDIATLGAGKAAVQASKVGLKQLAKTGAKTGAKLGIGYGLTGGLQTEKPTVGSVALQTGFGTVAGAAVGAVAEPIAASIGKLVRSTLGKKTVENVVSGIPVKNTEQSIKEIVQKKSEQVVQQKPYLQKFKNLVPILKSYITQQQKLYAQERGTRFATVRAIGKKKPGLEGAFEQLGAMKGELPKVKMKPIPGFTKLDLQAMMTDITNFPAITEGEQLAGKKAILDLFIPQTGVPKPPTESGLEVLKMVFGKEFTSNIEKLRPNIQKLVEAGYQIGNIPREAMAAIDFSASFRQAFIAAVRHPVIFAKNFPKQFKYFFSEDAFDEATNAIRSAPHFKVMKDVGKVAITDIGTKVGPREERFASNILERMTGGKFSPYRASARAYTGFLNKMRSDVFKSLLDSYIKSGGSVKNADTIGKIGSLVNASTGRGELLQKIEGASNILNTMFFSPRLMASRLHFFNPVNYIQKDPFLRKEYLKNIASVATFASTLLGLAKMNGAEIELDPRSSDFLKAKFGKTRVDILGGFGQYLTLGGRLASGSYKSTKTGQVKKFSGAFGDKSYFDFITQFFEYKEAPLVSFLTTLAKQKPTFDNLTLGHNLVEKLGQNVRGNKLNVSAEIVNRFIPLVSQDAYDLYREYGIEFTPLTVLSLLGIGLQTF